MTSIAKVNIFQKKFRLTSLSKGKIQKILVNLSIYTFFLLVWTTFDSLHYDLINK